MVYMVYILLVGILILGSFLFTGTWSRFLDLALYLGNVISVGLSFYIMKQGKVLKITKMFFLGVFVFLVNAWCIFNFFQQN